MATFQFSSLALSSSSSSSSSSISLKSNYITNNTYKSLKLSKPIINLSFTRGRRRRIIRAVSTVPDSESEAAEEKKPPSVDFVFVASVMMPDGSPDVQFRTTCGGQNLRHVMMDANIELYGPYARPLLNCAGAGICATCMVEVVEGRELLSPRTDKEKEKLKRKPKNWRLACQTTVGKPDSKGVVVIQQLPEWKAHEWKYEKVDPSQLL